MKHVHLIVVEEGEYGERTSYPLAAWMTRRAALDEADRLNQCSREFQSAIGALNESAPDLTDDDDEKYDREYDAFTKKRDALVARWRRKMRVPKLDHYDRPEFSVSQIVVRCSDRSRQPNRG